MTWGTILIICVLVVAFLVGEDKPCPAGVAIRLSAAGWIELEDGLWTSGGQKTTWQKALAGLEESADEGVTNG